MNKTVWKKTLQFNLEPQKIKTPGQTTFLAAQLQSYNRVVVWFSCNSEAENEPHTLIFTWTGQTLPPNYLYIATIQSQEGLVWHLWEIQ